LISFGVGLWQGNNILNINIPTNVPYLNLSLSYFIYLAFLLALFFFFWKKLHKSKPWLWGTGIGLLLMIIYSLPLIAGAKLGTSLGFAYQLVPYYGIIWILIAFGIHFLCSFPGILLSGLGPHLFSRGLKEKENIIKRIIFIIFGLLLIPVSLFWLLAVGLIYSGS
jgi:hypothetical protein